MVKGNWERRAELVAARRVEERNKKVQKTIGSKQLATAESVITKVQRDPLVDGESVQVWLESDSDISVCREWLRSESCSIKRCKLTHETTIAHLRNLSFIEDEDMRTENLPSGPFLLSNIPRRDYNRLLFLAVSGECVYDKAFPEVWDTWIEHRTQFVKGLDRSSKLSAIDEVSVELDRERGNSIASTELVTESLQTLNLVSNKTTGTDFSAFFFDADNQVIAPFSVVFSHLVPYLSTLEVRNIAITSKSMLNHCQRVEVFKLRRREALTQIAADLSREKKMEKKKKAKQANVKKESKKDGFARGGNS